MKMCPIVHFEMPYENAKRVSKFYESVFGWGMQYLPKMSKYVLATTTLVDKKTQRPKESGAINGGFYPKAKNSKTVHFVISVEDLNKYIEIVKKTGGKILGKPMDIPGVGLFIMFIDTEGNKVGMLQPVSM